MLEYWKNKNIVLKTPDDSLIEVLLERLLNLGLELTYMQFATAVNTIVGLFGRERIRDFWGFDPVKAGRLGDWVRRYF